MLKVLSVDIFHSWKIECLCFLNMQYLLYRLEQPAMLLCQSVNNSLLRPSLFYAFLIISDV